MKKSILLAALLLAGCAVGPNYRKHDLPVSPAYQDIVDEGYGVSVTLNTTGSLMPDDSGYDVERGFVGSASELGYSLTVVE